MSLQTLDEYLCCDRTPTHRFYFIRLMVARVGSFDFGLILSRVDLSDTFSIDLASNMNGFSVSDSLLVLNENEMAEILN